MVTAKLIRRYLIGLLIIGLFGLAGAFGATVIFAQDPGDTPDQPPSPVDGCAECHLEQTLHWQDSIHANAFSDPLFQEAWQEADDVQCLACHTTGFNPRTGFYDYEGVTCQACHGVTPENHPPESVAVDPGPEVCASCHEPTFTEWEQSAHAYAKWEHPVEGTQEMACTTCHNPHPQELVNPYNLLDPQILEDAQAMVESGELESLPDYNLCDSCHMEIEPNYAHTAHPEQACSDCHWYNGISNPEHVLIGSLRPTGHDNIVETYTCIDCHESQQELVAEGDLPVVSAHVNQPLLDAQLQIDELEAEAETARTQGKNAEFVYLIQGLLAGIAVGGLVTILVSFSTRNTEVEKKEESDE